MQMTLSQMNIQFFTTDADTPAGHILATGTDPLGNMRLFLFAGTEPTDEGFRGSILVPRPESSSGQVAYNRSGTYVAHISSAGSTKALLDRLVEQ